MDGGLSLLRPNIIIGVQGFHFSLLDRPISAHALPLLVRTMACRSGFWDALGTPRHGKSMPDIHYLLGCALDVAIST